MCIKHPASAVLLSAAAAREAAAAADGGPRGAISAAAGVTWRMKAVQRAQQLAKEQGRDVNAVCRSICCICLLLNTG